MQRALGTKVRIVEKPKKGGRIEIEYYSQEDLDRIYGVIVGE
jgi:ParB family chromosome partitioning protein